MEIVIVIGGGASGLIAALTAAEDKNRRVIVLERQQRIGRKLLATGNGRCNLTNTGASPENYHGENPAFAVPALEKFPPEKALEYFEAHPDTVIVTSGAQGADEPSTEAAAMRDYLVERGVPAEQILLEERSTNTLENIRYSLDVLAEHGYDVTADIAVVSNGFHLARVRMIWGRVCGGTYSLSTLAAPSSHMPSRLKMYVREPLALVKSFFVDR